MIDISMTATLRPEIHKEVINSLSKYLKTKQKLRLVINVDRKGDLNYTQEDVLKNFEQVEWITEIKQNLPKKPKFFEALTWVWGNSETDYVLQWEDDWVLHRDLYLDDFLEIMERKSVDIFGFFCKPKISNGLKIETETVNGRRYKFVNIKQPLPSFTPSILTQKYLEPMVGLMKSSHKAWQRPIHFVKNEASVRRLLKEVRHFKYISDNYKTDRNRNLLTDIGKRWKKENKIRIK